MEKRIDGRQRVGQLDLSGEAVRQDAREIARDAAAGDMRHAAHGAGLD